MEGKFVGTNQHAARPRVADAENKEKKQGASGKAHHARGPLTDVLGLDSFRFANQHRRRNLESRTCRYFLLTGPAGLSRKAGPEVADAVPGCRRNGKVPLTVAGERLNRPWRCDLHYIQRFSTIALPRIHSR